MKSTIQASSAASSRTRDAISSTTGTVRSAFAEPAGAGRLLADAAAGERDRLVGEAGLLAADAELDQHERRAVERPVEVVRDRELPVVAGRVQHARGETADDLAALGVDVVQDDVGQLEPLALARQPRHQLRGVGRATADDGELHRWTPALCSAATSWSWRIVLGTQTR